MPAFIPPKELNGIPLSRRTQWLLYAPTWMLFPGWARKVLSKPSAFDFDTGRRLLNDDTVTTASFRARNDHS